MDTFECMGGVWSSVWLGVVLRMDANKASFGKRLDKVLKVC